MDSHTISNLARAAESYGQVANYLERMGDADGAFTVRLDGLRVLHSSGATESVLTAAASVCMSAAARLGRDAQARQVQPSAGRCSTLRLGRLSGSGLRPRRPAFSSRALALAVSSSASSAPPATSQQPLARCT